MFITLTHFVHKAQISLRAASIDVVGVRFPQDRQPDVIVPPMCSEIYLKGWGHQASIPVKETRQTILKMIEEAEALTTSVPQVKKGTTK